VIVLDDVRKRLIHLHHCDGIGWKTIYQLLKIDSTLKFLNDSNELLKSSPLKLPNHFVDNFQNIDIEEKLKTYNNHGIKIITIMDKEYPPLLKQIFEPPWVLYLKGNINLLHNRKKIAVVGSRTPTDYGRQCTNYFVTELVKNGYTIISGLARGIDSHAHITAIKTNGHTIAVLGSGFAHIYPKEHTSLANLIGENHLLVSEYPPMRRPAKMNFPARNRIISGLSQAVLVVEAKEKSGSLITAQFALNEGRDVYSVPGSIFSEWSKGTNQLIQDGAKPVISIDDILEELQIFE
jgi:DNA processing protein